MVGMKEELVKRSRFTGTISVLALVFILGMPVSAISCGQEEEASEKIGVTVSILPLADFVENVGGEKVNVSVMVPPGASPHVYGPTPSQMAALARARLYAKVGSGVEFELVWMDKLVAINAEMLVVDCSKGIKIQEMAGEHEHGGIDPHIWMSPLNVKIMVRNICDGLVQVDPGSKAFYEKNRDAYLQELTRLDRDIRDGFIRSDQPKIHDLSPCLWLFCQRVQPYHVAYRGGGEGAERQRYSSFDRAGEES